MPSIMQAVRPGWARRNDGEPALTSRRADATRPAGHLAGATAAGERGVGGDTLAG